MQLVEVVYHQLHQLHCSQQLEEIEEVEEAEEDLLGIFSDQHEDEEEPTVCHTITVEVPI